MKLTPMMQQYYEIKKQYPDAILFFRLGDFYEMFDEDAKVAARVLEIALTSREAGAQGRIPMCGVPHHAAAGYLDKLIGHGYKVAICEQLEDPRQAKGVVKRDVVKVLTPGTFIEGQLADGENKYLAILAWLESRWGLAVLDMSTGGFETTAVAKLVDMEDEINRLRPAELVVPKDLPELGQIEKLGKELQITISQTEENQLSLAKATEVLLTHFDTTTLAPFGLQSVEIVAAALALSYVQATQKSLLTHLRSIQSYQLEQFLQMDSHSRQNLELTSTIREGKKTGSLLGVLDFTKTSMGARLLRAYIEKPLINLEKIEKRHEAVGFLVEQTALRLELGSLLSDVYDLERLVSRLAAGSGNARDLRSLSRSLTKIKPIKSLFTAEIPALLGELVEALDPLTEFVSDIEGAIIDDPPIAITEGNLIRDGYHPELDKLREASRGGKDWIRDLETTERVSTGIKSLKVGYNRIFGYYIEVTNPNRHLVPEHYERKQTLTNAERYITPELKEQEALILGADERINDLEHELFLALRQRVQNYVETIQQNAHSLATLDVLQSLARAAVEHSFVRPEMFTDYLLDIKQGRHPVIEVMEGQFVPNDTYFDQTQRIILLTGPNMAGKSTYLRQVAIIVILAQMGSFVPAEEAHLGVVDQIFTRIGASDDLSTGQSTFMVECSETSTLLRNATERSLVILDELGRGTSTFDGMAIAQAVIEYIHNKIGARTLFSTHFHELTKLEQTLKNLVTYRVEVEEKQGEIYFLHLVSKGSTDRSYGINVARMAGMPPLVLKRSLQLLQELEAGQKAPVQLDLFRSASYELATLEVMEVRNSSHSPLEEQLLELDLNNITPLEALQTLVAWQSKARSKEGGHDTD